MSNYGVCWQWGCLLENLYLLVKRNLHQGKEDLVCIYSDCKGTQSVSCAKDSS
jgi:hypothetical protein